MRINNNISAVITNNQLLRTENSLAASMERLASGLRINHASDNPSGMAIAGKMQAQIDGLDQASRNSSDGISVLQTADGALGEVTNMIQRMRELAVQAANGTNSQSEKEAIQLEIDSLKEEVDRIANSTEFNTKKLLNGSLDARVYTDEATRVTTSSYVPKGEYRLTVDAAAEHAVYPAGGGNPFDTMTAITADEAGVVDINGYGVELKEGMTGPEVYEALRNAAEIGEATISNMDEGLQFTSTAVGSSAAISLKISNADLAAKLGVAEQSNTVGKNAEITLDKTSAFGSQATVRQDGYRITVSDVGGFEISMMLEDGFQTDIGAGEDGVVTLQVTDVGLMTLQVGANEGQQMDVRIPPMDMKSLYLDQVDVTTIKGADRAMNQLDEVLARVSAIRSQLGAYENRLDYTVSSLDATEENMTAAISRINDVDMAEEMVEYTKDNVLVQAATSALAQANELPQMALQLLQ